MKKFFYIFLFFSLNQMVGYAQANLVMENAEILIPKDTVRLGDSLAVKYNIKNTGDSIYTGVITTSLRTNFEKTPLTSSAPRTVEPGKSILILAKFKIAPPYFQENKKSIIVIWPTGTGNVIHSDSLRKTVTTIAALSVREQNNDLSRVRFYPNPAQNFVNFEISNSSPLIKKITLTDLSGRILYVKLSDFTTTGYINLEAYNAGIYLINIVFADFRMSNYRLIKTN
ncbi:MAG: T9SS type A sorting domain-containing protein [Bacteroidia bacterium]